MSARDAATHDQRRTWWLGLGLGAVFLVAIGYLAITDQLTLYMHPRYVLFTVVMTVLGGVLLLGAVLTPAARAAVDSGHDHEHEHDYDHDHSEVPAWRRALSAMSGGVVVAIGVVLLVAAPPQALSAATAEARSVNAGVGIGSAVDADEVTADSLANLTIADWASLLQQTDDLGFWAGKRAEVVGFTTPDADDPENVVFVSRFVVTCCAVDAQAVGVPVYWPGWQTAAPAGTWVSASGAFGVNPSARSGQTIVLEATALTPTEVPEQQYVF